MTDKNLESRKAGRHDRKTSKAQNLDERSGSPFGVPASAGQVGHDGTRRMDCVMPFARSVGTLPA